MKIQDDPAWKRGIKKSNGSGRSVDTMVSLHLLVGRDVIDELGNFLGIKNICGELMGVEDEFVYNILKAIKNNSEEVKITRKHIG